MQTLRTTPALVSAAVQVLLLTVPASGQETTRVSVDSAGVEGNESSDRPSISGDGQIVAFDSQADNLVAGDTNSCGDIFVHDRVTGITERVSVDSSGVEGNGPCEYPSISADGQTVVFYSWASNLVAGDTNGCIDVFVHDRGTGKTERVSVDSSGAEANDQSRGGQSISADGQVVAFGSDARNLVAGDTNGYGDVFVHDRATGITERVSVSSSGVQGNQSSYGPTISGDGRFVAFSSYASNLVAGDTNSVYDIFVHDRVTGITERVSVRSSGVQGNSWSDTATISGDGRFVAFSSRASNLVAGDRNSDQDVFVHDRVTGITERVSVDSSGAEGNDISGYYGLSISADGRIVAFDSTADNLVAGDTNFSWDIFVHDRVTGITERVSVDSSGVEANSWSFYPSSSGDGQVVVFSTGADNLVAGDTNGYFDVFVHERCELATWTNYGVGFPGTNGVPAITSQQNPVLGTTITIDVANSYGNPTVGLLFIGFQQTIVPTNKGGDLLVVPALTMPITFSYGGDSVTGSIPDDPTLCGVAVDVQAIEADPGAAKGVSFTEGLELVLGH